MDIFRLIGVGLVEYPYYLLSSKYDYSRFWNKCIHINTLYTKILQAVAVNYISNDFYFHFNNIPYTDSEIPAIEHITPTKVIGSGMISIVFEGVDKDGKLYVIKTKRIGIDDKIVKGLQQIKNIIYWIKYIPYINIFSIDYIFEQFESTMVLQLSFEQEIKNHKKFKEINAYTDTIVIPDLYEEYCTSTQIVMSKIEGTHYSVIPPEISNKYAKYIIEMTAKNLLIDGFIHSDLHAGNIIFTPDGKIGIIDFGLIMQLNTKDKQGFFDILKGFSMSNYESTAILIMSDFVGPDHVKQKLSNTEIAELRRFSINKMYEIHKINKIFTFNDIHNIIQFVNKYNLHISNCFYNLLFFIISCECLISTMTPSCIEIFIEKIKILCELDE